MILRTDLYAAIRLQDRIHKTEKGGESPVRALIGMLAFLLVSAGGHYFYMAEKVQQLRPEAELESSHAAKIQKELQSAQERIDLQREKVARRSTLFHFANRRLSWAPVLQAVFEITPPTIEMTSVKGTCFNQERSTLVLSGRTATRNSRLDCDKFRLLLVEALSKLGITAEGKFARLDEVDSGAKTGNAFLTTVFEIELTWKNQSHGR